MPTKQPSVTSLKKQLKELQDKLAKLEGDAENSSREEFAELFSWESPERVFVPKNKKWFINVGLLVTIILLFTLFLQEFLLMGVVLAVLFVTYMLATVPPVMLEHRITTQGIITGNHAYLWDELTDFWFKEKYNHDVLVVSTVFRVPSELHLVISARDQDEIRSLLLSYLPYREVTTKSWLEKTEEWFTKKISSI